VIKERQIRGNMEGVITHREDDGRTYVDPLDAYLCDEHFRVIKKNIDGGMEEAERRSKDVDE
jgi:hypothetical protein